MMKRRVLLPLVILVFLFSCFNRSDGIGEQDIPAIMDQFLALHVRYSTFDDALSERTMDNLLNTYDPGRYFFYANDIAEFNQHADKLDDYVLKEDYSIIYTIHDRYIARFNEQMEIFDDLVDAEYDFNRDETIIVDREEVPFASTKDDMKERWRKHIKLQLLNYTSSGVSLDDAREKLEKRYRLMKKRVKEMEKEDIIARFLNAFSTSLDPHSNYLTQDEHEDFKISFELKLEGIGARLRSEDGFVIVDALIPGGAADKMTGQTPHLKPNDKIIGVAQGSDGEFVDVIDMDLRDVVKKIRGEEGSTVRLSILRKVAEDGNQERFTISIVREEIKLQDQDADSRLYQFNHNERQRKIGYIKLPSFYQDDSRNKSSSGDLMKEIEKMRKEGAEGIVLDLRGNPGGALEEAHRISSIFIHRGAILQVKDGTNPPYPYRTDSGRMAYNGPLVLLINSLSASASEIVAGAIRDYDRGLIIGPDPTFGKGTVQSYRPLSSKQGAIKITTHIFYQPSGTSNQLNGIAPHITVPSMSSIWGLGESKERYPLKWEKIPPAEYKSYSMVSGPMISRLQQVSKARTGRMEKYTELMAQIDDYRTRMNEKTLSLKEDASLQKEKEEQMKQTMESGNGSELIDEERDLFLMEAFRISADYFTMTRPRVK